MKLHKSQISRAYEFTIEINENDKASKLMGISVQYPIEQLTLFIEWSTSASSLSEDHIEELILQYNSITNTLIEELELNDIAVGDILMQISICKHYLNNKLDLILQYFQELEYYEGCNNILLIKKNITCPKEMRA